MKIDILKGATAGTKPKVAVVKIAKRHMQTMVPPSSSAAEDLVAEWTLSGKPVRELPASGWEAILDGADPILPPVQAKTTCARCQDIAKLTSALHLSTQNAGL